MADFESVFWSGGSVLLWQWNIAGTVDDLREALESNGNIMVKDIEIQGIQAVEGTAYNPENENNINSKQICFIANDKCYELVVYHDKDATGEKIAQKILDGLSF